jgi:hypothetical protein
MTVLTWTLVAGGIAFVLAIAGYKAISTLKPLRRDGVADWKRRRNPTVSWRMRR